MGTWMGMKGMAGMGEASRRGCKAGSHQDQNESSSSKKKSRERTKKPAKRGK
jgi:hypothetical protein